MSIADTLLPEFDQEMAAARRVIARVPEDDPGWKPHPKVVLGWLTGASAVCTLGGAGLPFRSWLLGKAETRSRPSQGRSVQLALALSVVLLTSTPISAARDQPAEQAEDTSINPLAVSGIHFSMVAGHGALPRAPEARQPR